VIDDEAQPLQFTPFLHVLFESHGNKLWAVCNHPITDQKI
jgi:hypothetical protein